MADFSLSFEVFPESLQPVLHELDESGDKRLDAAELTEMITKYRDMKAAEKLGAIAVSSFSPEVQKTLAVFDSSGDGLIEPCELQRAAELYADSRLMVSRLIKLSVVLLLFMGALLGCIAGLTIAVVEGSKEQKTEPSGITTVKGQPNTPVATASVKAAFNLTNANNMTDSALENVKSLTLKPTPKDTYIYTITGVTKSAESVTFHASRGDTVVVRRNGTFAIVAADGRTVSDTATTSGGRRRRLLQAVGCPDEQKTELCGENDPSGNLAGTWTCCPSITTDTGTDTSITTDTGTDTFPDITTADLSCVCEDGTFTCCLGDIPQVTTDPEGSECDPYEMTYQCFDDPETFVCCYTMSGSGSSAMDTAMYPSEMYPSDDWAY